MSENSVSLERSDHRTIGQRLGLFKIDAQTGKGLPLWLPNGTIVRDELEKLARELEFKAGFQRVATPHIARTDLYYKSGHLPYFREDMYPEMEVGEQGDQATEMVLVKDAYVLRPMNCPHHHRVFSAEPRSFRDLPLRLAEYGQVYRWERSGALSGLARVRGMCMNDGHIYCTKDQVEREVLSVLDMYRNVYDLLGITRYRFRLSRRDPSDQREKYVDEPANWEWAETLLADLLTEFNVDFDDGVGHAAFYGPKVDIQVTTAAGAEETLSTVQLDFVQPGRLGLSYVASSGRPETPMCIHRSPFSTHERMVAFLTELYRGAFPTWLAPVQLLVIPVSERVAEYTDHIVSRLRARFIRAKLAPISETVSKNVREAVEQRVPNTIVVGPRERQQGTVMLRQYGTEEQLSLDLDVFERLLWKTVETRSKTFCLPSLDGDEV
jgi:threonyl-tRNA synthetase